MKNATQRQLKVFESVARLLSYSRAAEELHLSQPAVSTQVKLLEEHAGLPLFEQLGKKIYLTQAGVEMLRHARAILGQFRAADDAMSQLRGVAGGNLNIAVISAGDYFFPRLLAQFLRKHEGVEYHLSVYNREELLHQLSDNLCDLAVMARPPTEMDCISEPFAPHPYVVVAAPGHPLASRRSLPISAVLSEPFILRERGSDTWSSMETGFGRRMKHVRIAMEIRSTETIKQAVMAGMGLSFLSAHTVAQELELGRLTVLDIESFPLVLNWHVVHRASKQLPAVAQAFKEFLRESGASSMRELIRLDRAKPNSPGTRRLARL